MEHQEALKVLTIAIRECNKDLMQAKEKKEHTSAYNNSIVSHDKKRISYFEDLIIVLMFEIRYLITELKDLLKD